MDIKRGRKAWQVKLLIEGDRTGKLVNILKKYSMEFTALMALSALIVGLVTIFVAPWLQWLRLFLSTMTFFATVVTTGRVVSASITMAGSATMTAEATVEKS